MSHQPSTSLNSGRRHPTLDRIETALTKVTHSNLQAPLQATSGGVLLLPRVMWLPGPIDHAKSHRGLLPYPITWSSAPLMLVAPDSRCRLTWHADGWGRRFTGTTAVVCSNLLPPSNFFADLTGGDVVPETVFLGIGTTSMVARYLASVRDEGEDARWSLHAELSAWLRTSLELAHRAVCADMKVRRCLDDAAMDDLFLSIELGAGAERSLISTMIDRLADPTQPRANVDVARFVKVAFRRDAELALRRRLDDPRWVGPALRAFAREHPLLTLRQLVERFNESGRLSERVGIDRARRALSPCVQPEQMALLEQVTTTHGDDHLSVAEVASALRCRFAAHGGIASVARRIIDKTLDDSDESLTALRSYARSQRLLSRIANLDDAEAARVIAQQLLDAGAS